MKWLGGAAAASALRPSWVSAAPLVDDYFIFIHAAGGWDVTLWADPRNERRGLVEPASTANSDASGLAHWKPARLDADAQTFEIVTPPGSSLRLGPALGSLLDLHDRLTIINGISMNTVSHEDGTNYSATGRHRSGSTVPESSIDVLIANELGADQLMPDVSVRFPSAYVGDRLDRRAIPLRVTAVDAITKTFARSSAYLKVDDRAAIEKLLVGEAQRAALDATSPELYEQLASQHAAQPALVSGEFADAFSSARLRAAYPQFDYHARTQGSAALGAAFALEAIRRDVVRCVSFGLGGLDTHNANYRQHGHTLQELFGVVSTLVTQLDQIPHPHRAGAKLGEHTHILVISEFCRTPQINLAGGRDHYPNNSALVISPRFRPGQFGHTDPDQLLPTAFGTFVGGSRAIAPPDVLATFLGAFQIDPRRYMRDGEVVKALLR